MSTKQLRSARALWLLKRHLRAWTVCACVHRGRLYRLVLITSENKPLAVQVVLEGY